MYICVISKIPNGIHSFFLKKKKSIKQTRWRIDDVWNSYISEAWNFIDEKTCVYDWSEEDKENFNEEYGTESDAIKPTDAVRAALFVFFIENKEAVLEM